VDSDEHSLLPDENAATHLLQQAHLRALNSLSTAGVASLILRFPVASPEPMRDLDLLVAADSFARARDALEASEFLPKTSPLGMPSKVVFATYEGDRFHSLDVHTSIISRGLVYLDAGTILRRRVVRGGFSLPSLEDSILHLVLHTLLGRNEIGGKYATRIRELADRPLDKQYMERHLSRFGLQEVFWETLSGVLGKCDTQPERLWRRSRRRLLLRVPGNVFRRARYRLAGRLRIRRRAGVAAFMGVDGVGKTSLVSALQKRLSNSGLTTTTAYLGCWGRYQTRARWVLGFSPRDSPSKREGRGVATIRVLKNQVKFALFYGGIVFEQSVRYRERVVRAGSHLVLADRYLYDLEIPFSRRYVRTGRRLRLFLYRLFPAPDLIFHLQGDPQEILARKAELTEEQLVRFEGIYGEVLGNRPVVRLKVEGTPDDLARSLLERYWKLLIQACWRHA
jgi:thymidylate kinase